MNRKSESDARHNVATVDYHGLEKSSSLTRRPRRASAKTRGGYGKAASTSRSSAGNSAHVYGSQSQMLQSA
jgi:hypothetical protein